MTGTTSGGTYCSTGAGDEGEGGEDVGGGDGEGEEGRCPLLNTKRVHIVIW